MTDGAAIRIGDIVRVRAARRRDITWRVTKILADMIVAVNDTRGAEIRYRADSVELVERAGAESPTSPPDPALASPEPRRPQLVPNAPGEYRDTVTVRPRDGEDIESLVRRWKKCVDRSGILAEERAHRYYVAPGAKRRAKSARARVRRRAQDAALLAASKNL